MGNKLNNPFLTSINSALANLKKGNTILYPTDTVWGIGCDATNENAVKKVYQIKQRDERKSLIILVDSIEMLQNYIPNIPKAAVDLIKNTTKPTSIIYKNPIGLAKNVIATDHSVAMRIVQDNFCLALIRKFGKPIVSTSANISNTPTPTCFTEIDAKILHNVDYIVALHPNKKNTKSSRIIKILKDGSLQILRK